MTEGMVEVEIPGLAIEGCWLVKRLKVSASQFGPTVRKRMM